MRRRIERERSSLGGRGGGGRSAYKRACDARRLALAGVSISDFGLTYGVLGKTVLYLAVKVLFRVACEKI